MIIVNNGIKIFYDDIGYGRPVILLHGYGQSSELFEHVKEELAGRYRLILIDSRNHGRSERTTETLTIKMMSKDVIAVMDKLEIKTARIIGFSDGGNIALQTAVDAPDRLQKIVAISANARPEGLDKFMLSMAKFYKKTLKFFKMNTDMINLFLKHPQITNEQLKAMTTPTMLVYGQNDIITVAHRKLLNKLIPKSILHIIAGATHGNIMKKWSKYQNFIDEFLE